MASSSSTSPCAACKFLRRKCLPECVFAPYFPPDQPQKFASVHKVFGASNVTKLLIELQPHQREDAVNSLAYEADMRLRDPVYGCVGVISLLQHQLHQLQMDLSCAKSELSKYQSLDLIGAHHQGINLIGGGGGAASRDHDHHRHRYFLNNNHHHQNLIRDFEAGSTSNGYDVSSGLLGMNGSAGLSGFQQARENGAAGDGRRTQVEPSS